VLKHAIFIFIKEKFHAVYENIFDPRANFVFGQTNLSIKFLEKIFRNKNKNKLGWNRFRPFMSPEEM
jgi:hypothetical protein